MIEQLRQKHRRTLVIAAFRGKFFREPDTEELNRWLDYLDKAGSPQEMLTEMRRHTTALSETTGINKSPGHENLIDFSISDVPTEQIFVIDWDAVRRVKQLIFDKSKLL